MKILGKNKEEDEEIEEERDEKLKDNSDKIKGGKSRRRNRT